MFCATWGKNRSNQIEMDPEGVVNLDTVWEGLRRARRESISMRKWNKRRI